METCATIHASPRRSDARISVSFCLSHVTRQLKKPVAISALHLIQCRSPIWLTPAGANPPGPPKLHYGQSLTSPAVSQTANCTVAAPASAPLRAWFKCQDRSTAGPTNNNPALHCLPTEQALANICAHLVPKKNSWPLSIVFHHQYWCHVFDTICHGEGCPLVNIHFISPPSDGGASAADCMVQLPVDLRSD